jgi:steroid delta-isomerase-like uncharacterized protein
MENETILTRFIQKVWNEKDTECIPNFVSSKYTIHSDSSDPWEFRTLNYEEFAMRLDYSFDSFPDIKFEIQSTISDGDNVAITWIMTGTNSGQGAFPPTNKAINTNGMTIYHFNDGKICGHTQVFNKATVRWQLGF